MSHVGRIRKVRRGLLPFATDSRSGRCAGTQGSKLHSIRPLLTSRVEQDVVDIAHGDLVLESPLNDVKVLAAVFEVLNDRVDQRRGLEGPAQEPEIALIELDPERLALKVLEPAVSQEPVPVLADPHANGHLAQVMPCLFTFDPLELQGFFFSALVQTHATRWKNGP